MNVFSILLLSFLFNTAIYVGIGFILYLAYKKERKGEKKLSDDSTTRNN